MEPKKPAKRTKYDHLRILCGKTPEQKEHILNIAYTFAELYRGIYPFMTIGTRDKLIEIVLKGHDEYVDQYGSRGTTITTLAQMIVAHQMSCLRDGGIVLPPIGDFGQDDAVNLEAYRKPITALLRPDPTKLNPLRERGVLEQQLKAIPPIQELINHPNPFELFEAWAKQSAKPANRNRG